MNLLMRASVLAVLAMFGSIEAATDETNSGPPSNAAAVQPTMQAWQVRRAAFQRAAQGARQGDPRAQRDFDAVLTEFETRVLSRTPMENVEIMGAFYVPKQGPDPALSIIVQNLVLGWYDALRFASESGRAEILNNEGFFKKAFILGGPDVTDRDTKFLKENPGQASQLVAQGISFAEKFRETQNYDRHWPTAYGLERVICAQGGSCTGPSPMPKEQWDAAWEEAKHRVTSYFQATKPK
jgi:hypothetical protein